MPAALRRSTRARHDVKRYNPTPGAGFDDPEGSETEDDTRYHDGDGDGDSDDFEPDKEPVEDDEEEFAPLELDGDDAPKSTPQHRRASLRRSHRKRPRQDFEDDQSLDEELKELTDRPTKRPRGRPSGWRKFSITRNTDKVSTFTPKQAEDLIISLLKSKHGNANFKVKAARANIQNVLKQGLAEAAKEATNIEAFADVFHPHTLEEHVNWALEVLREAEYCDDENLHPLLSLIYLPYAPPKFEDKLQPDGTPVRSQWKKGTNYPVVRDIPWLPDEIPLTAGGVPNWKLCLYRALGATPDDMAHRIKPDDPGLESLKGKRERDHDILRKTFLKRTDDWRYDHGGLFFLDASQELRKGDVPNISRCVFTGMRKENDKAGNIVKERRVHEPLTSLQIQFNTLWDIDAEIGIMRQPGGQQYGGASVPHRLYQPIPLPERMKFWMNKLKIPIPNEEDLAAKYPNLFQPHLYYKMPENLGSMSKRGLDTPETGKKSATKKQRRYDVMAHPRQVMTGAQDGVVRSTGVESQQIGISQRAPVEHKGQLARIIGPISDEANPASRFTPPQPVPYAHHWHQSLGTPNPQQYLANSPPMLPAPIGTPRNSTSQPGTMPHPRASNAQAELAASRRSQAQYVPGNPALSPHNLDATGLTPYSHASYVCPRSADPHLLTSPALSRFGPPNMDAMVHQAINRLNQPQANIAPSNPTRRLPSYYTVDSDLLPGSSGGQDMAAPIASVQQQRGVSQYPAYTPYQTSYPESNHGNSPHQHGHPPAPGSS